MTRYGQNRVLLMNDPDGACRTDDGCKVQFDFTGRLIVELYGRRG